MTRSLSKLMLASLVVAATGCGEAMLEGEGAETSASAASDALLIAGKADVSDTTCNVVLRTLSRTTTPRAAMSARAPRPTAAGGSSRA